MKTCTQCGESKSLDSYRYKKRGSTVLRSNCKACDAAYRAANKEKAKEYQAAYYVANLAKVRARHAAYYALNTDKCDEMNAKWRAANQDVWRTYNHNRRARRIEVGGKLSPNLAERLFKLQRGKCACGCAQPLGDNYHLDHIMPLALGGSNTDDNIQLLRHRCNSQKCAKHPVEFMRQRGFLL